MNEDWKNSLASLLAGGSLPEGEDIPTEPEKPAPWPKLTVTLDRKRAGKTATIISGFTDDDPRCAELATTLKRRLAVGGSSRGGEILIQGDHVKEVKEFLSRLA